MTVGRFGNKITPRDGFVFDSKSEAEDWTKLQLLERAGHISCLERQVKFVLQPGFVDNQGERVPAITWTADFAYIENGERVVWDTKGFETIRFKLVSKMFRYQHPEIRLIINHVGKGRRK